MIAAAVLHWRWRTTLAGESQLAVILLVVDDVKQAGEHLLAVAANQNVRDI